MKLKTFSPDKCASAKPQPRHWADKFRERAGGEGLGPFGVRLGLGSRGARTPRVEPRRTQGSLVKLTAAAGARLKRPGAGSARRPEKGRVANCGDKQSVTIPQRA